MIDSNLENTKISTAQWKFVGIYEITLACQAWGSIAKMTTLIACRRLIGIVPGLHAALKMIILGDASKKMYGPPNLHEGGLELRL